MDKLTELLLWLLALIPLAAAPRAVICIVGMMTDELKADSYKTKLKNLIYFVIFAECATGFIALFNSYFF